MGRTKKGKAFSPCHITGFFQIFEESSNLLNVGSKGAGVSINYGVESIVTGKETGKNSVNIKINGSLSNSAVVSEHVITSYLSRFEELEGYEITVEHAVATPIGAGFGASGAAALSLALALKSAFNLSLSEIEAAQFAHIAEVECKTGLGTVLAETVGGVEVRSVPGAPGIGKVHRLPIKKNLKVVCLSFGSLSTKDILTDKEFKTRINASCLNLVEMLLRKPKIENFLMYSRRFAEKISLITERVRRVLLETDKNGFVSSMPMFGEAAFTLIEEEKLQSFLDVLYSCSEGGEIIVADIDYEGARLRD
jgi:pantoate kinase